MGNTSVLTARFYTRLLIATIVILGAMSVSCGGLTGQAGGKDRGDDSSIKKESKQPVKSTVSPQSKVIKPLVRTKAPREAKAVKPRVRTKPTPRIKVVEPPVRTKPTPRIEVVEPPVRTKPTPRIEVVEPPVTAAGKTASNTPTRIPVVRIVSQRLKLNHAVEVPIILTGAKKIAGIDLELRYNPKQINVEEVSQGEKIKGFLFKENTDVSGVIKIVAVGSSAVSGDGVIANIVVKALGKGMATIEFVDVDLADDSVKSVKARGETGKIWISQ